MSTVTISRPNVTLDEVSAALREGLGSRYEITPAVASRVHHEFRGHPDSILVKRHWFEQANVRVVPGATDTEIHIGGAATFTATGFLINRASVVRKVHQVLEQSTELAGR
jgi:hypothetical protein